MTNTRIVRNVTLGTALALGLGWTLKAADAPKKEKPKYTVSEVMDKAHKGQNSLIRKVAGGNASEAELKQLLAYYQAMAQSEAPKGDAKAWATRTSALVKATEGMLKGDKAAQASLREASNCKSCHAAHRPE